jgi:hypothetical protein
VLSFFDVLAVSDLKKPFQQKNKKKEMFCDEKIQRITIIVSTQYILLEHNNNTLHLFTRFTIVIFISGAMDHVAIYLLGIEFFLIY